MARGMKSILFAAVLMINNSIVIAREMPVPQFSEYKTADRVIHKAPLRLLTKNDRAYRTRLREGYAAGANFAGHYAMTLWGCGTECSAGAAINLNTGLVVWMPFTICCARNTDEKFESIIFHPDSSLIIFSGMRNENEKDDADHFYRIDGDKFVSVVDVPRKTSAQ